MPNEFWIIVAVGAVIAVVLALIFGRSFIIKWKDLALGTGETKPGVNQTAQATGAGSSVKRVKQQASTGGNVKQDAVAKKGGGVEDIDQRQGQ
jgi:hypothetical protein